MEYSEKEFYKLNEKFTIISIGELYRLINIENKSHYTLNNSSAFFVINLIEKRWANIPFLVRELVRTYAVTITEARDDLVAFLNEAIEFGVVDKQEFLDKEAISGTKMPIPQPPTISHEIDEKLSLLFKNFEDKIFKVEKKVDKVEEILVLRIRG